MVENFRFVFSVPNVWRKTLCNFSNLITALVYLFPFMLLSCRLPSTDVFLGTNSAPLRQQGDISEGAQNTMTGFDFDRLPQV